METAKPIPNVYNVMELHRLNTSLSHQAPRNTLITQPENVLAPNSILSQPMRRFHSLLLWAACFIFVVLCISGMIGVVFIRALNYCSLHNAISDSCLQMWLLIKHIFILSPLPTQTSSLRLFSSSN